MKLEIHYAADWAALYVDGKLERVGDSYLAEERAFEMLGVTVVHDDAFMRGQSQRMGVADTLEEVAEWRTQRDQLLEQADQLEAQAEAARETAAELRAQAGRP